MLFSGVGNKDAGWHLESTIEKYGTGNIHANVLTRTLSFPSCLINDCSCSLAKRSRAREAACRGEKKKKKF